jgi:hypothetical protein
MEPNCQEVFNIDAIFVKDRTALNYNDSRSTSSNILTATYGWPRITEEHRPLVKRIHDHTARLSNACIPGTSMVDIFPAMNRLPLWMSKWKRNALEWHERETQMFEGFYHEIEDKMVSSSYYDLVLVDDFGHYRRKARRWTHLRAR